VSQAPFGTKWFLCYATQTESFDNDGKEIEEIVKMFIWTTMMLRMIILAFMIMMLITIEYLTGIVITITKISIVLCYLLRKMKKYSH